jgi:hypothetical protein
MWFNLLNIICLDEYVYITKIKIVLQIGTEYVFVTDLFIVTVRVVFFNGLDLDWRRLILATTTSFFSFAVLANLQITNRFYCVINLL